MCSPLKKQLRILHGLQKKQYDGMKTTCVKIQASLDLNPSILLIDLEQGSWSLQAQFFFPHLGRIQKTIAIHSCCEDYMTKKHVKCLAYIKYSINGRWTLFFLKVFHHMPIYFSSLSILSLSNVHSQSDVLSPKMFPQLPGMPSVPFHRHPVSIVFRCCPSFRVQLKYFLFTLY